MEVAELHRRFRDLYGSDPLVCRAPGRVNLIGEHTDYNDGFVMPAAIDFFTWCAVAQRNDSLLRVRSTDRDNEVTVDLTKQLTPQHDWSDYIVGVARELLKAGYALSGADLLVHGEVPIGAGLSSSAALEVSVALALLSLNAQQMDRKQLALLCQRAENQFVGTKSGIMDQFISANGKPDHALMLDCRSLDFQLEPLPPAVRLVVCNTMVKHSLVGGEYNIRREQCEEGVRLLQSKLPEIRALRDVTPAQLETYRELLPPLIYRRCRHVVTENERVLRAADALRSGNLKRFGELMAASHTSLRDDYEVSCPELDLMVSLAQSMPGVFGARMTGGGFGGCTINLVAAENADSFARNIAQAYEVKTRTKPDIYITTAAEGATRLAA